MFERQIEKCEVCCEDEYIGWELFQYKKKQILTKVCSRCAETLMNDQFSKYRTIIPKEYNHVKVLRRK